MNILSMVRHMFKMRRQRIFCLDDQNAIITVTAKLDIQISKVTPDNVDRVTDFRTAKHTGVFREYLAEGQLGIYAWVNGKVVGHGWGKVCTQPRCVVNGYMALHEGEAFIHYCNVSEPHRRQNIYPLMLAALCHQIFDEASVTRIVIDSEVDNLASLRGVAKAGFKPVGSGIYLQVMGRRIFKHTTNYAEMRPGKSYKANTRDGQS